MQKISQGGINDLPVESYQIPYLNKPISTNTKPKTNYSNMLTDSVGILGSAINAATPMFDTNELIAGAQTSIGNVGGITYSKKLGVDSSITD